MYFVYAYKPAKSLVACDIELNMLDPHQLELFSLLLSLVLFALASDMISLK